MVKHGSTGCKRFPSRGTDPNGWSTTLGFADSRIEPASADASFRRYFRITRGGDTHIIMDAPPDKEDLVPFITVARILAGIGLNVPIVLARDERTGIPCCCRIWDPGSISTN